MPRSRTFKIVHTFYLLVIAVLITLLFVERQKHPEEPSTSALSEQLKDSQQTLTTRIRNLSEQMDSRFAALEERLPQPHTQDEPHSDMQPTGTQRPPVQAVTKPESTVNQDNGDAVYPGDAMTANFDTQQGKFATQSVDADWAYPSLALIREQFADDDYLRGLHLADIDCRSNICQVDIDVADPESINPVRLLQALNRINDNDQGFEYQLLSRPLDDTYRVLVLRVNQTQN